MFSSHNVLLNFPSSFTMLITILIVFFSFLSHTCLFMEMRFIADVPDMISNAFFYNATNRLPYLFIETKMTLSYYIYRCRFLIPLDISISINPCILITALYLVMILINKSGDIELNPGPPVIADTLNSSNSSIESYASLLNRGLSIMHLNIQSLKPKIDILAVEAQPYDVLIFTETWLSNNVTDTDLYIPNFSKPFRCDRIDRIGGGVAIYVRDSLHAIERKDLQVQGVEALWTEIHICQRKLIVGGIYRPPNSNNTQWLKLEYLLDQALNQHVDNILVAGDFNINVLANPSNKMTRLIHSLNCEQLINSPTHYTESSNSLLDLMFIKKSHHVLTSFVADPFLSDLVRFHCPIVSVLNFTKPQQNCFRRKIWIYDKGEYQKYNEKLSSIDWSFIDNDQNPDNIADCIDQNILNAASESIPNRIVTIRPNDVPWINNDVKKQIRKRRKLHQRAKLLNNENAWANFRKIRNETTKLIKKTKSDYQNNLTTQINSDNITAKTWFKLAKKLTNKQSTSTIPTLTDGLAIAESNKEKADLLNTYFSKQSTIENPHHPLPPLEIITNVLISGVTVTTQDVKDSINSMDSAKASGPDLISPRLIKEGKDELASPLARFFNKLLLKSVFPSSWKLANVCPIYKKSDPSKTCNYRPISLLCCLGKVMERCIHKYLYNHVISNKLLTPFQSGFIKGDSTINQLTFLYNDISKALDEGKEVRAVFCDISKAFDRVWHQGLLYKLSSLGIQGSLLQWFSSYLADRKQRVIVSNTSSTLFNINAGVPQGSILGPLLFLIYINDIVTDIEANIRLFADDTSLYIIVEDPNSSAAILNCDLSKISVWSKTWLVSFNPSKTEHVLFSRKRNKP